MCLTVWICFDKVSFLCCFSFSRPCHFLCSIFPLISFVFCRAEKLQREQNKFMFPCIQSGNKRSPCECKNKTENMEKVRIISRCTQSCWEKFKLGISCNYQSLSLATGFPETKSNSKKRVKRGNFCLKYTFLLLAGSHFIMLFQIPISNLES